MRFEYSLDDRPPYRELIVFGLQWFAIAVPSIIIIGKIVASLHFSDAGQQTIYLQKMAFIMAVALFCQVLWGHRLPLVLGPSAAILIGVLSSQNAGLSTIYSAVFFGGWLLLLLSLSGLLDVFTRLFTPSIVAAVLLLVAFTLMPTVLKLVIASESGVVPLYNLVFAFLLVLAMFVLHRCLTGIWKLTLIVWSMAGGTVAYLLLFGGSTPSGSAGALPLFSLFLTDLTTRISFDAGVFFSFMFCFVALLINDLGSIQSVNEIVRPSHMPQRINRGIAFTGIANILSGFFGVVGPVNFSLSAGVIVSTGCASRFTLIPAALLLLPLSLSPLLIGFISQIPSVVVGSVLTYVLVTQIGAGLIVAFHDPKGFTIDSSTVIGLPILFAIMVAFLPVPVLATLPAQLKPIAGNSFIVGVVTAMILEHVILRR
jgi:xanthine/uracil permease